ncbi:MAG: hypothetical protein ACERKD_06255 [Prolixibacteraceae bacterium]
MPYRRLPNTDRARLRALAKSHTRFETTGALNLPYSDSTLNNLRVLYPNFRNALLNLEAARKNQAVKNKEYQHMYRKAKIYLSHYLQVMNFAILRGELKPTVRAYYTTDRFENHMPVLQTENDLINWGKKIIDGDQARIMKGGSPFYNPSIALVKITYEKFCDAHRFQQNLLATTDRNVKIVADLRKDADELIVQLWNEIEAHYENLDDKMRREKAEEFGLVYVLRRKEKKRLLEQEKQTILQQQKQQELVVQSDDKIENTYRLATERSVEKTRIKQNTFQSSLNF